MSRLLRFALLLIVIIAGRAMRISHAADGAEHLDSAKPTIEQWMNLKGAANPRISPDGRSVAYTIRRTDWDANAFDDEIWIAQISSAESYQLTDAKGSSESPQWSPDGKRLAFLSNRDGGTQIYLASLPSKEVVRLTQINNGVNDFHWSSDGRSIAFTTFEVFPRVGADETPEYTTSSEMIRPFRPASG